MLLPLWLQNGVPTTLLTRRSPRLRRHPGQIAFPGGAREPQDLTPGRTALREAREEVSLPDSWRVLGCWTPEETRTSRFRVVPVLVRPDQDRAGPFLPDGSEVVSLHVLPVPSPKDGFVLDEDLEGGTPRPWPVHVLPTGERVWGLTGRLLWRLARFCEASPWR